MRVVPVNLKRAKAFISEHHRHNRPPLAGIFSVGLEHDGKLVGVAIAGRPVARMLDDGRTLEVTRCCTLAGAPKGAVSCLYGACKRAAGALGYSKVLTYTLATESGASLRGAGWKRAAKIKAAPGWDRKGRPRAPGTVDNQEKIRWEA